MKRRLVIRYLWALVGICINSLGIALITKAALGTSPISSLPYVLSFRFPLSLGQFTFVMNLLFILLQILLLRRNFPLIQLLQLVVNIIFSVCIDWGMALLAWFQPTSLVGELLSLLLGCAVLALGISIEVAPGVLMVPGEGAVSALAQVSGKRFGIVKICFDVTLVAIALTLSFLFFHRLQGLGLGTVVSALLVGRFVIFYNRLPLLSRISALKEVPC